MSKYLLETIDLKKHFKTNAGMVHAVDGVNLQILPGETLGVVGESGCGKSTLGRTIIRLLDPTSGQVIFDGEDIASYNRSQLKKFRTRMQIIFQDPFGSLNPRLNIRQIISEPMIVNGIKPKVAIERTRELMETVGLAKRLETVFPHELDGGRRQRIGVARAMAVDPEFIVCDEPVSALDVSIQAQILNLLMDLQEQRQLTYLFITHDLTVVKLISSKIAVMYLGVCVETTTSDELFENPLHPYTKALLQSVPIPDLSMKQRKIEIIRGEVTSPIDPEPGCRFAPRCRYVTEKCWGRDLMLREVGNNHFVACTLYE